MKKIQLIIFLIFSIIGFSQVKYGSNHGKFIKINGTNIYYEEYGKGKPLLLLHGGLGDISDFKYVIPKLSQKYRVIIPDMPSLGKSDYANSPISYQLFADYQSKFIDALKLENLYVIGWSDGANTGLILAKNRPEKIKKLIISGANYKVEGFKPESLEECKKIANVDFVENNLQLWIKHYQSLSNKDWKRYISEVGNMWFEKEYFPKSDLMSTKTPTLVIYGDNDMYTIEHGLEIKNALPNSQFCVIPNCSHEVFSEKPDLFVYLANSFFNEK